MWIRSTICGFFTYKYNLLLGHNFGCNNQQYGYHLFTCMHIPTTVIHDYSETVRGMCIVQDRCDITLNRLNNAAVIE